jgi:4-hydroxy-tetrahydrodipicolinate reductase
MPISLAVSGIAGRMGQELARAIVAAPDLALVGGAERPGAPAIDTDIGALIGAGALGLNVSSTPISAATAAEGWIDFTTPIATLAALDALKATKVKFAIIGTTGLDLAGEAAIHAAANRIAIVRDRNFSLGVNLLAKLVKQAAQALGPDWDIEILEAHHRHKVDAPSGTALMLGEAAAEGRGETLAHLRLAPREGMPGARPAGGIGFAVIRGGGIFGQHDARFISENEILSLSHQAMDRGIFVRGALAAARWAAGKPPGLYSMQNVLGL